jgi:hypothetical protein
MTSINHREWENAWFKMAGWVVTIILTLSYEWAISGVCTHVYACECTDFMDTRGYRISCSIQIVCINAVPSISKCFTEFLYIQQLTTLFSDTTEGIHRDLWKDYESYCVVWNLPFTLLICQFLLSCYDHRRFLYWNLLCVDVLT